MLQLQNLKWAVLLKQESATNGATLTSDYVDCSGFGEAVILIHATTSNNATNKPTITVLQSDDTEATNFAAITALTSGTSDGNFTAGAAPTATTTAPYCKLALNLQKRKRYLKLTISPLTTQTFSVLAGLGRAAELPVSTTEQNVATSVVV